MQTPVQDPAHKRPGRLDGRRKTLRLLWVGGLCNYGLVTLADTLPWPPRVLSIDAMKVIDPIRIRYKYRALEGRPKGSVGLRLHVDESGRVLRAEVVESSTDPVLDGAALRAARQARFEPAVFEAQAVAVTVAARLNFE